MKLWQRYLFFRLCKTFSSFLLCLFTLYLIVDLSIHGIRFFSQSTALDIFLFYTHMFAALFEMLITFTFLLTVLRVLFDLNLHRELTALQMAGLSKKRLLSPFFLFAGCLSFLCFFNSQWVAPHASDQTDTFRGIHKHKKLKKEKTHVYSLSLTDNSELIYQRFDPVQKELFDLFWIRSPDDIWHMKTLEVESLQARHVDHFTRNEVHQIERSETMPSKQFSEIPWNSAAILHRFIPFENRPLFTLVKQALTQSGDKARLCSHLFYKLLLPCISFLILFAIAPLCMRFSRTSALFAITTGSMFGFIAIKVVLDGMLILGENQVLPSSIALFAPIALLLIATLPSYVRMQ